MDENKEIWSLTTQSKAQLWHLPVLWCSASYLVYLTWGNSINYSINLWRFNEIVFVKMLKILSENMSSG